MATGGGPAEPMTGYAVANPGLESITIRVMRLKDDEKVEAALQSFTLGQA